MHFNDGIRYYLGWCPNAPALRSSPAGCRVPEEIIHPDRPGGKDGIPARVRRGAGIARGSIRILIDNKRLLVFSLLTAVAILFMFAGEYLLRVAQAYPHPALAFPVRVALTFGIEVITVFWITVLLAGTIASASSLSGRSATHPEPATILSLAGWSVVLALAGTSLFLLLNLYAGDLLLVLFSTIARFPFGNVLEPGLNGQGPITGLFHQTYAATYTLLFTMINLVLFAITLYVVPAIVIGKRRLPDAIAESAALVRKTWGEVLSCIFVFCLALLAVSVVSGLFSLVFGLVPLEDPFWSAFYYQGWWYAAGALYMVVWYIIAVAGSTAFGIAIFRLYDYGKTGRVSSVPAKGTSGEEPIR